MVVFFKPKLPLFFSERKMTLTIFSSIKKKFSSVLGSFLPLFVYNCLIQMSKEATDKSPFNLFPKILKTFHSKQAAASLL